MDKIVVFTGAGVSAESGLSTFRDNGGLWENHSIYDVATPEAFARNPQLVLDFYNQRRRQACAVKPNAAHLAIAELERCYDVTVVTQNVDSLHEQAGSSEVIHLHGELHKARSTSDPHLIYDIGEKDIQLGDVCEKGSQLRPHIVWFGEAVPLYDEACAVFAEADKVLVVGTSLSVYPAAGLVEYAENSKENVIVAPEVERVPFGFTLLAGPAGTYVPQVVERWLAQTR